MKRKEKKEGTWWQKNKKVISYVAALGLIAATGGVAYIYINKYYNLKANDIIEDFKKSMEEAGAKVIDIPPTPKIDGVKVNKLWTENGYAKAIVAVDSGVNVTKAFDKLGKAAGVDTTLNGFYATIEWDHND